MHFVKVAVVSSLELMYTYIMVAIDKILMKHQTNGQHINKKDLINVANTSFTDAISPFNMTLMLINNVD